MIPEYTSYDEMEMIISSYGELIFDWHQNYSGGEDSNHYTALYDTHGILILGNTSKYRIEGITKLYNELYQIVKVKCFMTEKGK